MFRWRGQPYITYLHTCNKVIEFYDFKRLRFWRFLPPEYEGKIYQPHVLTTGVPVTFFEVGHSN